MQRARKLSQASKGDQQLGCWRYLSKATSAPIMILTGQRDLINLADVPSGCEPSICIYLIPPSEEMYNKCTYPLCFDFSKCHSSMSLPTASTFGMSWDEADQVVHDWT